MHRCKEVRGQPQRDRGRTLGTMCTCEEIERGTHACRASKLGPVEGWCTQGLKTCHFAVCFTSLWTSISVFYFNTARDVVTVLLIFAKYLSLYLHIFTYRGTHTQAHTYNQHTRGMATTRHRSLVGRDWRQALLETLHIHTQKKNVRKNRYSRI